MKKSLEKAEPRKDLVAIQHISEPVTNLQRNISEMKIISGQLGLAPQQGVLSVIESAKPLDDLYGALELLEATCDELIPDISTEQQESLTSLRAPLQKLADTVAECTPLLANPQELKIAKPEMKHALSILKEHAQRIISEMPQTLQILSVPLEAMTAVLEYIEEVLEQPEGQNLRRDMQASLEAAIEHIEEALEEKPRRDLEAMNEVAVPLTKLQENIKEMQLKSEELTLPQRGVLSIVEVAQPITEMVDTIQKLETSCKEAVVDITPEHQESLAALKQPLEELAATVVESTQLLSKPEKLELEKPKMKQAVVALKENIQKVSADIPQMKSLQILSVPLEAIKAAISHIEESLNQEEYERRDLKAIKQIAEPAIKLKENLNQMQMKSEELTLAQRGVLSIVEVAQPLNEMVDTIQRLETSCKEAVVDITPEHQESLAALKQPLEELAATVVESTELLSKPEKLELKKPKMKQAVVALKQNIQKVSADIPQMKSFIVLSSPLAAIKAAIEQVEGALDKDEEQVLRRDLGVLTEIKEPVIKLQKSMTQMHIESQELGLKSQEGILSVVEITKPLSAFCKSIEELEAAHDKSSLDISADQQECLRKLKQPMEKLSAVVMESTLIINEHEKLITERPKVKQAVVALKEQIENITAETPKTETLRSLSVPLKAMKAAIELVEKRLDVTEEQKPRRVTRAIQEILEPVAVLQQNLTQMQIKSQELKLTPQQGIISILKVADPLNAISASIENLEATCLESSSDISPEEEQKVSSLKPPLEKLAATVVEITDVLSSPRKSRRRNQR
nr:unnamed protein product [Callosobruchus chinensis]